MRLKKTEKITLNKLNGINGIDVSLPNAGGLWITRNPKNENLWNIRTATYNIFKNPPYKYTTNEIVIKCNKYRMIPKSKITVYR